MLDKYKNWLGDKVWYKNWKAWLSIFVVFGIAGAFIDDEELEEEASEPEVEEVVEAKEEPEKKEDEEKQDKEEEPEVKQKSEDDLVNEIDQIGESIFKDKYTKTDILWDIESAVYYDDGSYNPDESLIDVINTETFLNSSEIGNFLMPATEFLEEVKDMNLNRVHISADGKFVDQYGEESNQNATYLEISKETIDKINFENFDWRKLPDIADDFWMHQSMGTKGLD